MDKISVLKFTFLVCKNVIWTLSPTFMELYTKTALEHTSDQITKLIVKIIKCFKKLIKMSYNNYCKRTIQYKITMLFRLRSISNGYSEKKRVQSLNTCVMWKNREKRRLVYSYLGMTLQKSHGLQRLTMIFEDFAHEAKSTLCHLVGVRWFLKFIMIFIVLN